MYKKFKLNRTKIKGAIGCQSEVGQVSLVFSVLYYFIQNETDVKVDSKLKKVSRQTTE